MSLWIQREQDRGPRPRPPAPRRHRRKQRKNAPSRVARRKPVQSDDFAARRSPQKGAAGAKSPFSLKKPLTAVRPSAQAQKMLLTDGGIRCPRKALIGQRPRPEAAPRRRGKSPPCGKGRPFGTDNCKARAPGIGPKHLFQRTEGLTAKKHPPRPSFLSPSFLMRELRITIHFLKGDITE